MRARFFTLVARVRDALRPVSTDADIASEIEVHLALAAEEYMRRGMSGADALRQARLDLGGVTQLREAARAARGLPWLETFWLDGRLGARMLRRSWGLTVVGGLAMALTIGLGASVVNIWETFAGTALPLAEGDRVVALQAFDKATQRVATTTAFADFDRWRQTLRSLEHVSAMRASDVTVIAGDETIGPVHAAEMTASAFQVARVQPVAGRYLIAPDEQAGADAVVVIGYDLWRSAFSLDPSAVGRHIQVGDTLRRIVGVMPAGFRFPVNQRLWIPLQGDPVGVAPARDVFVFARLAPAVTLEAATGELVARGLLPKEGQAPVQLEPRVVPYAAGFFPDVHANAWASTLIVLFGALLLVPPCANIAILVYARTVTRREEFAARAALGASRSRIVMQLFIELLLLAAGAGAIGLVLAGQFSGRLFRIVTPTAQPANLPFWMDFSPSLLTVLCVTAFSLIAAAIAGGLPALHATGRWRRFGFSGSSSQGNAARLGKTWIALLATQVALTLAILPSAAEMLWGIFRPVLVGPSLAVDRLLSASLVMEGETARFDGVQREVVRQLAAEPGITGASLSAYALMEEPAARIEVQDGGATAGTRSDDDARFNLVDDRFFEVFDARFLAGRRFDAVDFQPGSNTVIVNRSFVTEILGRGNALGRRIRYRRTDDAAHSAPAGWQDIVGVIEDVPGENDGPMLFHPMRTPVYPASVTVRAAAGVGVAAERLRAVTARLDPRLRTGRVRSLEEMYWQRRSLDHTFGIALGSIVIIVVLFAVSGLYTLMTFIVAQRRREIGVRSALGARPRRLVVGIFGRALVPLLIGAVVGSAAGLRLQTWLPIAEAGGRPIPGIVPLSVVSIVVVGLLAAAGPARRAIRIDPTESLRVI